jgi:pSer/pThr/pTyr-binding forkhead associated (FHA) protein
VTAAGFFICDGNLTNGTFLNGESVRLARLQPGQNLLIGDVELLVESTDVVIAVPEIKREVPTPPRKDWMSFLERTVSLPRLFWKNRTQPEE